VLAYRVDQRRDELGEVRRARPRELVAKRGEPVGIVGAARFEPADDEVLERLLQGEQGRDQLAALVGQRRHNA